MYTFFSKEKHYINCVIKRIILKIVAGGKFVNGSPVLFLGGGHGPLAPCGGPHELSNPRPVGNFIVLCHLIFQ